MNYQDIIRETYDTDLKAQKVSLVSAATIYAVVSADIIIGDTIGILGNVTLSDSKKYIGLTTTTLGIGTSFIGLVTASLGNDYGSGTIFTGVASGASGVTKQLGANTATWCIVKADSANATTVFIGPSLASVNTAFPLEPGEATGFSISNTNLLYLCATGTFSVVRFTGGL